MFFFVFDVKIEDLSPGWLFTIANDLCIDGEKESMI